MAEKLFTERIYKDLYLSYIRTPLQLSYKKCQTIQLKWTKHLYKSISHINGQ